MAVVSIPCTFEPWPISVMANHTEQPGRSRIGQIFSVMVLGAKPLNTTSEQTKLNPGFNHQTEIVKRQRFKRRHKLWQILFSTDAPRHEDQAKSFLGEGVGPGENLSTVSGDVGPFVVSESRTGDKGLDLVPSRRVFPIQQFLQLSWVERGSAILDGRVASPKRQVSASRSAQVRQWIPESLS